MKNDKLLVFSETKLIDMQKVALITGSAKRIGRAMAHHLASKGWSLALHYNHSEKDAEHLLDELEKDYPKQNFILFQSDLHNLFAVEELTDVVINTFGRLDMLINNAAVFEGASVKETHFDLLEKVMMINYRAPFLLMRDFARSVEKGLIINIVDTRITTNEWNYAAYTISKKALWELTKMAALELAPNIRVNAIAPGAILPPENKAESYLLKLAKKTPMQQPGGFEPICSSLQYIIENEHLVGQILFCDGGQNLC